jgi:hypothetical protein
MQSEKINSAIRACLDRCYESKTPLFCIAGYMDELRASRQWTQAEMSHIHRTVLHMLKRIYEEPAEQPSDDQAA